MEVKALDVKKLREETGAGMMDCKNALTEAGGDFKKAVELLRIKGMDIANKKSTRAASQGLVFMQVSADRKTAGIVEVNCETDFVTRNPEFPAMGEAIVAHIAEHGAALKTVDDLKASKLPSGKTVNELVVSLIAKIGENMGVKRFERWAAGPQSILYSYLHRVDPSNLLPGAKVGVLIEIAADKAEAVGKPELVELAKELTLQITAMQPRYVDQNSVDATHIAKEREILKAKNLEAGKPADKIEKIVDGQIRKFYEENCLVNMVFARDNTKKVSDVVAEFGKKADATLSVKRFVRFKVGDSE